MNITNIALLTLCMLSITIIMIFINIIFIVKRQNKVIIDLYSINKPENLWFADNSFRKIEFLYTNKKTSSTYPVVLIIKLILFFDRAEYLDYLKDCVYYFNNDRIGSINEIRRIQTKNIKHQESILSDLSALDNSVIDKFLNTWRRTFTYPFDTDIYNLKIIYHFIQEKIYSSKYEDVANLLNEYCDNYGLWTSQKYWENACPKISTKNFVEYLKSK